LVKNKKNKSEKNRRKEKGKVKKNRRKEK